MIKPRNDFVLVRILDKGVTPGDKVEHLNIGDKVLVIGQDNVTYAFIPNSRDLFIVKEAYIPYTYDDVEDMNAKPVNRIARK